MAEVADKDVRWAGDVPGTAQDWYEFSMKGDPDTQGELLRVRMDVSFLLSTWKCIFGQGCPGVLMTGAMEDRGCCQIGVHMAHDDTDYKRVRGYVDQLTEEDLDVDLLKVVRSKNGKGWRRLDTDEESETYLEGYAWHTNVVDGACVLANRAGGSTGKLGCSLHVLANRLGVHHSETKPNICWQIPISVGEPEYDEDRDQSTITIQGTPGSGWGGTNPTELKVPGWWCTETPDAYVTGNGTSGADESILVFRTNEVELRKMLSDAVYEEMVIHLKEIIASGGRRAAMPGETINNGRPLLPLIIKSRLNQWVEDELPESKSALKRSHPLMRKYDCAPDGYKLPRLLKRRPVEVAKIGQDETITTEVPVE